MQNTNGRIHISVQLMNNRFTNTNYDTRNQAFHLNDRTVNFYNILCISLQAYLGER